MKKNLILSIHLQYANGIVRGQKTVELRRKFPLFKETDRKKIFIYACSPVSKIIGKCDLIDVQKIPIKKLWNITRSLAKIDEISFQKYFINCDFGFALYLTNPLEYKEPISLKKLFGMNIYPPQSYRYVCENMIA
ncbi:MAG: ASCH domain-containing protein [Bdellovibrionales bacterium]|nr:ASCH domain-containing protein [Bdellovibrionales bacterium]